MIASGASSSDLDEEVYQTATSQRTRGLLSKPLSKEQVDMIFGVGNWRAIRCRGLRQGEKVRRIDNTRASKTNFAAFLVDTITTTPADIDIQVLSWLFKGKAGRRRFIKRVLEQGLTAALGADDHVIHGVNCAYVSWQ